MKEYLKKANSIREEVIKHRRFLHENAEIGFTVPKTTDYIYKTLKGYGVTARKLKKGGVIAEIEAKDGGRDGFVLLRADVDGLKLKEESDFSFSCKNGCMHACGHDLHAAALLGAAKLLKQSLLKNPFACCFSLRRKF